MDPIEKFKVWQKDQLSQSNLKLPHACCLSTIGLDGIPNARFVSLKETIGESFVITGPTRSQKGLELSANAKAALTFWWAETEKQIRIQGSVNPLSTDLSDEYFAQRNLDSRIVSMVSDQGKPIDDLSTLLNTFEKVKVELEGKNVPRPEEWGGWMIKPIRIEFLEFQNTRFHKRELYTKTGHDWTSQLIQP